MESSGFVVLLVLGLFALFGFLYLRRNKKVSGGGNGGGGSPESPPVDKK